MILLPVSKETLQDEAGSIGDGPISMHLSIKAHVKELFGCCTTLIALQLRVGSLTHSEMHS